MSNKYHLTSWDVVDEEMKPLYAFILALIADVSTLENNRSSEKNGPSTDLIFRVASFGYFSGNKAKYVGWKNIAYATAVGTGIAMSKPIADVIMKKLNNSSSDGSPDDNRVRAQLIAEMIGCSLCVLAVYGGYYVLEQNVVVPFPLIQDAIVAMNRGRRGSLTEAGRSNILKGVNSESVLQNPVKSVLTALGIVLSSEGIVNLLKKF